MTKQAPNNVSLELLDKSDRFNVSILVKNGEAQTEIKVDKESTGFAERLIKALNDTFNDQ